MTGPLWVVTDQLPDPPRNGITLPLYHYCRRLQPQRALQLVLLEDADAPPDPAALARNEAAFGPLLRVPLRRRGPAARALAELRRREMFQHGWRRAGPAVLPAPERCDSLLVSPMSAVAKWQASGLAETVPARVRVAAVNDCTSAEYFFRGLQQHGVGRAKAALDRWRSRGIAAIEAQLLAPYDHVLMQTEADRALLARLVGPRLAERVSVVSNGVVDDYFALQPTGRPKVVFVAELSGEYAGTARWLATEVWPQVLRQHAEAELVVVGRHAAPALRALLAGVPRLRHLDYVDDLGVLYADAAVALSPVFKGFGLINKTLEAMAAGLPVVGGAAAFNGIPGFRAGVHGVVCSGLHGGEFAVALRTLLGDAPRRAALGAAARQLVHGGFRWDSAVRRVGQLLDQPAT
ncbi:MAG: glycosyltransferase family 4 protein [Piscinibacter sp.]|nr:glycosyltransferase family 4 protein [Piscinibacter sp.]